MNETLSASCHCGAIRLRIPSAAAGVLACHCGDCQKMHGNFNAFLAVPAGDVELTGGDALQWYQSSEASRRGFCRNCGSRVVKEETAAGRWLISAGLVDGQTGKRIVKNLWEQSKPDWYDLPGVPA